MCFCFLFFFTRAKKLLRFCIRYNLLFAAYISSLSSPITGTFNRLIQWIHTAPILDIYHILRILFANQIVLKKEQQLVFELKTFGRHSIYHSFLFFFFCSSFSLAKVDLSVYSIINWLLAEVKPVPVRKHCIKIGIFFQFSSPTLNHRHLFNNSIEVKLKGPKYKHQKRWFQWECVSVWCKLARQRKAE